MLHYLSRMKIQELSSQSSKFFCNYNEVLTSPSPNSHNHYKDEMDLWTTYNKRVIASV